MPGIPAIEPYPMPSAGELPANTARWTPDADRAVLLVHDMQRFFVRALPDQPRHELVSNAAELRDRCAALSIPVAYTAQPGGMSDAERGLLKDFWGAGMRVDPEDRQVIEPLTPARDDWLLTKRRYSAFFRSGLLERMREHGRDQLLLCGVYAHIGVLATAIESFGHDIETFLVADAVADFSAGHHAMALRYAADRCAVVTTTKGVLA
jgi:isochorismate hydrolase